MSIGIHSFTEEHLPALLALEQVCFADPWGEADLRYELTAPTSRWLVAQAKDGTVLGYVGSHVVMENADILNVAVAPEARRQGVGRALLTMLLMKLTLAGVRSVTLEVRESNAPALGLYTSMGFAQAGRRAGYYDKPREDALVLRRALGGERL